MQAEIVLFFTATSIAFYVLSLCTYELVLAYVDAIEKEMENSK